MNPIKYLKTFGFLVTSDPFWFKTFGYRDLWSYGANVDSYCGGYHRAYDMAKYHNAPIPSIANATVLNGTGWNTFGWTLVLGFIDKKGRKFQVIYGHLNQNPLNYLKIGQNVKKGQTVAYQGASNNLGVSMASHLHIQFQNYKSLNEWNFTCLGISPLDMDISSSKPTSNAKSTSKVVKPSTKKTGFNKRKGRKTRNKAYAKGVVRNADGLGASQYRWSGGKFTNRMYPDIKEGETVFIYATTASGWAKIYSPNHKGWVYLDRVKITQVF